MRKSIWLLLSLLIVLLPHSTAFTGDMPEYCSDKDWCFDFASDETLDVAESNGTHVLIKEISGWSENLLVGSGGDINVTSQNKTTILMYKHNSSYDKFNASGNGSVTINLSKQPDTDFDIYEDDTKIDTKNSGSGWIEFTASLSEHQYEVITAEAVAPTITSTSPSTPVTDYEEDSRTFSVDIDQSVDVTWTINGSTVKTESSVTSSSYTNSSAVEGVWEVKANASNANGSDTFTWTWDVDNYAPVINDLTAPTTIDPGLDNSFKVNVTDHGLDDLSEIECRIYRTDSAYGSSGSASKHYTITYDVSADSLSSTPPGYSTLTSSIDTSLDNDLLEFDLTPERYALPSQSTGNATVNSYNWNVRCYAKDNVNTTFLNTSVEMAKVVNLYIENTSLSTSVSSWPTTVLLQDNQTWTNRGNVWVNGSFSGNDLSSGSNYIGIDNLSINDEYGAGTNISYSTSTQYLDVNLTTQASSGYSSKVYHWLTIPSVPEGSYSSTISFGEVESHAR